MFSLGLLCFYVLPGYFGMGKDSYFCNSQGESVSDCGFFTGNKNIV